MTSEDATRIASQWVREQFKRELPLYASAERRNRQEWTVAFENIGSLGERMDGPIVVIVDEVSAQVRFF